jgi:selT/selW/selH-like putative selenoprotein
VAEEILKAKGETVGDLRLIPSSGGVFEVIVNGRNIFSKKELGRHAEPGEVLAALDAS